MRASGAPQAARPAECDEDWRQTMTRRQLLQGLAAMPIGFSAAVRATAQGNSDVAYGGATPPRGNRSRFLQKVNGNTEPLLGAGVENAGPPSRFVLPWIPGICHSWRKVV